MVHAIADDLMAILPRVICFPERDDLEATGEGFCRLAGHSPFRKAVGAIDGCHQLYPPCGYALLGDGGYPCLEDPIQIITPYREPVQGPVEARFNRHHSKARSIIERAFGLMKPRSISFSALEVHPTFAPKVVAACAVLHNICLADVDALEEERVSYEYYPDLVPILTQETPGQHLRARLAEHVSAPVSCPASLQDHIYFHYNTPL
ncbi:hypothetical protein SKAU_G00363870 [Synaphobranchus kaupii]|uniref:DDE Tnp4 domain-containing protein n=1 Tax=Synaphobranchus kaupii TaxID=118154 RepID=A0A9Q1IHD0_SYNKA|nr:hypothetical protein SKAU_G00363870 [Synaphobranchus kaupii]